ncbi:MAG: hypothetical protein ACRDL7_16455, partial [Gaiellaceae bacterium]
MQNGRRTSYHGGRRNPMSAVEANGGGWWRQWPLLAVLSVVLLYNAPLLSPRRVALGGDATLQY